jgi:hypothetical protein
MVISSLSLTNEGERRSTMSTAVFEDYLGRMSLDFDVDEENQAIDIHAVTQSGVEYVVTLISARSAYTLFVSPLIELGDECDIGSLYKRLLQLNDLCRSVKLSLDDDGDVKISSEGFSRLDSFGQFRRRVEALMKTIDRYGQELADLGDGELL